MPRYSTKTLLIFFGIIGLWLATFAGQAAAQDLRHSILLLVLVAAASMAVYSHGRQRAFWGAFAIVMFLCGGLTMNRPLHRYLPDFVWQERAVASISSLRVSSRQPTAGLGVSETLTAGWTLALSALAGFVAAYIYSRTHTVSNPPLNAPTLSARAIVEQELHGT
jgi:hypothetical protein